MYKIEIHQTIHRIVKIFYQLGLWKNEEEPNYRKMGRKIFYLTNNILLSLFLATLAFLIGNNNELVFLVEYAICIGVITIKLACLLLKKEEILAILYDRIHYIPDRDEYKRVEKKIESFIKLAQTYILMTTGTTFYGIISCLPVFTSERKLPFFITFCFDWKNLEIMHWISYAFIALGTAYSVTYNIFTVIIWYIMLNYSVACDLLGNKLRNLGNNNATEMQLQKKVRSGAHNSFHQDLIDLMKEHLNIYDNIEKFRSCFTGLFLAQITIGGIYICISTYNLAFNQQDDLIQTGAMIVFLIHGLSDIFLVMYLANEIKVISDRLSYCLFESNWIDQSESCKKYIIILCEFLRQPLKLVIVIYPMNLETFVSIINRAYSMFNLLKKFK